MSKVIHIKKFMGGRKTPEEVHAQHAFPLNAKCQGCGKRPMIRAIVMMELSEARKNPLIDEMMLVDPQGFISHVVQIRGSDGKPQPYFRCSVVYSCNACRREMEKQLAKAPSHCIVEINRGPGPDRLVTGPT